MQEINFTEEIEELIKEHNSTWKALKKLEKQGIVKYEKGYWYLTDNYTNLEGRQKNDNFI